MLSKALAALSAGPVSSSLVDASSFEVTTGDVSDLVLPSATVPAGSFFVGNKGFAMENGDVALLVEKALNGDSAAVGFAIPKVALESGPAEPNVGAFEPDPKDDGSCSVA